MVSMCQNTHGTVKMTSADWQKCETQMDFSFLVSYLITALGSCSEAPSLMHS